MNLKEKPFENIVGKGVNVGNTISSLSSKVFNPSGDKI